MWLPSIKGWELAAILTMIAVLAMVALPGLSRAREASRRASCQNNLKQWGLVMKMYAGESRGERWPSLSRVPFNWFPDIHSLYPEYMTDPGILVCPDSPWAHLEDFTLKRAFERPWGEVGQFHPDCAWHASYVYTGFTVQDDEQAVALFEAALSMPWDDFRDTEHQLPVPVWEGSSRDAGGAPRTGFSVMWDRLPAAGDAFNHAPPGANVLLMDGSVHFVRYNPYNASHNFPVTHLSAATFGATAPRRSADCLW